MPFARALFAVLTLMPYVAHGQPNTAPAVGPVFAVGYVETQAKEADAGRAALVRYRQALERQPGCLGVELFAQTDRPGHFAVVETWKDQAGFDGRDAAAKRELMESLARIRVSDYDERPYKPLTPAVPEGNRKHSVQILDKFRSMILIQVHDDFRVAIRSEAMTPAFQILS